MRVRLMLVFLGVAVLTIGCQKAQTPGGAKDFAWKQEVLLSDGRTIVVDRYAKQARSSLPQEIVVEYEKRVSFTNPDTNERVSWILPKGTGAWLLDFDKGVPSLVLKPSSVIDYNTWNCPNPPWLVFRYEGKEWKQVPIEALPERFVRPNLLHAARTDEIASSDGYVTVSEMDTFLREKAVHKTVSRKKISPVGEGCYESNLRSQGRDSEIYTGR